ncbi:MAG: NPCBM/NEW2 domain-containing protein [Thermoguttaceae bacterium]
MKTSIAGVLVLSVCVSMALARTWTDSTGKHTVEAEFISLKDRMVQLRKPDGSVVTVRIEKLSYADQVFLKTQVPAIPIPATAGEIAQIPRTQKESDARANPSDSAELRSASVTLAPDKMPSGKYTVVFRLRNSTEETAFSPVPPMSLELIDNRQRVTWQPAGYSEVNFRNQRLICTGEAITPSHTTFQFTDTYLPYDGSGCFEVDREIAVLSPSENDIGFMSQFALPSPRPSDLNEYQFFVPGIWYIDNRNLPRTALASDYHDEHFFFREDRLPLPIAMMRDRKSGTTIAIAHKNPNAKTFAGEDGLQRIIDERMQFGSLGIYDRRRPTLAFSFPGTEGQMTYVYGSSVQKRWALRSHPVKEMVRHKYELLIRLSHTQDFGRALADTWRQFYADFNPPLARVDLSLVYRNGIAVLDRYGTEFDGVPGFPFSVSLPDGKIKEVSFQMGFVGQQIPAACHLIEYALDRDIKPLAIKGESIIDFWTKNSLTAAGLPRTWFDVTPSKGWRDYKTFLRIASDGAVGVLHGWGAMERHGRSKPQWLAFCETFGGWLVKNQNSDGSFYRQYNFDGRPVQKTKYNTTHPVRFLVDLCAVTGKKKYLEAAMRAGEFCREHIHRDFRYVGGTPDNPDVMDKEAGLIALDAFLALYDATRDKRWLDCAIQAAEFSETWLYCWNVPMPEGDGNCDFPSRRTTCGLSIISTGHSGADSFMAYYPFQYYRLYLYSGDKHFLDVAKLLLYNTKQIIDWDGSIGYAHPGLQTEAMTVSLLRGHSVKLWLPWLTVAALDPLVQLKDAFGSMLIEEIERLPLDKRQELNQTFGIDRGLPRSPVRSGAIQGSIFLDDMMEISSSVGHGMLGKRGSHGYGFSEVAVRGVKAAHSLSFHPPPNGSSYVIYDLRRHFRHFHVEVAISDAAPKPCDSLLTFRITGDGRQLWKSHPMKVKGTPQECSVEIEGVRELKLEVRCAGANAWAFAVWIDPVLTK